MRGRRGKLLAVFLGVISTILFTGLGVSGDVPGDSVAPRTLVESGLLASEKSPGAGSVSVAEDLSPRDDGRITGVVIGPSSQPEAGVVVSLHRAVSPWSRGRLREFRQRKSGSRLPPPSASEEVGMGYMRGLVGAGAFAAQSTDEISGLDLIEDYVESVTTAANGFFSFSTLRGPNLWVEVAKPGFATVIRNVSEIGGSVTLRMRHGFQVEGYVRDLQEVGVAGCAVLLEPGPWSDRHTVVTRTDREGRFAFEDAEAGLARVSARHSRFAPATLSTVNIGSGEVLEIVLRQPKLEIRGRVTVAGQPARPVAGAVVRGFSGGWNRRSFLPHMAETNEDGDYTLTGLGNGNLRVEIRHPDFSTQSRTVPVSRSTTEQSFELVSRVRIAGRLIGNVKQAGIRLRLHQQGEPIVVAQVDEEGRFSFAEPCSSGRSKLELLDRNVCFADSSASSVSVHISEGGERPLELDITKSSAVRGVVYGDEGQPLAGAKILRHDLRDGPFSSAPAIAVTDSRGRFELSGLSPSWRLLSMAGPRFYIQANGYAVHEVAISVPPVGGESELEPITMLRPGEIAGSVVRGKEPLAGAVVWAVRGVVLVGQDIADREGRFALRGLPPGDYRIKARYSTLPILIHREIAKVESGSKEGPFILQFPKGRTIDGVVSDEAGKPVPNARVLVLGMSESGTRADGSGQFRLEIPAEPVRLRAHDSLEVAVRADCSVPMDRDRVSITLPKIPRGSLSARLLGFPEKRPVTAGILRIRSLDPPLNNDTHDQQRNVLARWVEMPSGRLWVQDFPAGRSEVTLQCDGFGPLVREVNVREGEIAELGPEHLDPGAVVSGIVVNSDGDPIVGAWVHLGLERDLDLYDIPIGYLTGENGEFHIAGVMPRSRQLVVSASGFAPASVALNIPKDLLRLPSDPLVVELGEGAIARVQVRDAEGRPDDDVSVFLEKPGRKVRRGVMGRDGWFEFRGLPKGDYEVVVLGGVEVRRRLEVAAASGDYEMIIER